METAGDFTHAGMNRWERAALVSGVVYGVIHLVASLFAFLVVVPTHAPLGAPVREVARALGAHSRLIAAGTYLFTVPAPFMLLFLGGVSTVVRRATGGAALAVAAVAAGVATVVIVTLGAVLSGLSASLERKGGDPAVVAELDSITPLAMALSGFSNSVLAGAISAAVFDGRIAPRWVGWSGVGLVALSLASTLTIAINTLFPLVLAGMLLFPMWIVAVSVALLVRPRQGE